MLNKHPATLLDAADVVRVDRGQRGLFKFVIERDCEILLFSFVKQPNHDYEDFLRVWNEHKFYLVHFAGIMKEDRPELMQEFYNCFIDHFRTKHEFVRIGVFYALYFMYYSQPPVWDRCGIRVEQDIWQQMHAFFVTGGKRSSSKEHGRATLAFYRLIKDSAFVFVAQTDVANVNPFEVEELKPSSELLETVKGIKRKRIEQDAASACSQRYQLQDFNDLANAYQKAKALVLQAPQALITAQAHLKRRTTVTEYNEKFLRSALHGSTLASKEADFQRTLDTASAALWKARQTRLNNMPVIFNESKRKRYTRRLASDANTRRRRSNADISDDESPSPSSSAYDPTD